MVRMQFRIECRFKDNFLNQTEIAKKLNYYKIAKNDRNTCELPKAAKISQLHGKRLSQSLAN